MGKYSFDLCSQWTSKGQILIANELAEANRLKRLELNMVHMKDFNFDIKALDDQA